VFILANRGTGERHIMPAKDADESTVRLLLVNRQQESLTVYTDGVRAYEPLERTMHSLLNTSSMSTASTLIETFTWTVARAMAHWCDPGSLLIEESPRTNRRHIWERFRLVVRSSENQEKMLWKYSWGCTMTHQQSTPQERCTESVHFSAIP